MKTKNAHHHAGIRSKHLVLALTIGTGLGSEHAQAQANLTWNVNGGGAWDTATSNWTGGSAVFTDGDHVTFNKTNGGTIDIVGTVQPGTTTVSATSGTYTFSTTGVLGGTGSLSKSGNGTLILSGTSSYTGGTLINAGKLVVNGDNSAATGNVDVTGFLLAGAGIIGGNITVAADALLAPGRQVGGGYFDTLTAAGDVTLSPDAYLSIEISGADNKWHDTLAVAGTLDITGSNLDVLFPGGNPPVEPVYVIATYGSLVPAGGPFAKVSTVPGGYELVYDHHLGTAIALRQIGHNYYDTWIDTFPVSDPGFEADDDGDNLTNGIESFFGSAPDSPNTGLTQVAKSSNIVTFRHPSPPPGAELADVTGSYQWSLDHTDWYAGDGADGPGGTTVTAVPIAESPSPGTTTVYAIITGIVPDKMFFRVVASWD